VIIVIIEGVVMWLSRLGALLTLLLAMPALGQDKGYTWLVDRESYVLDADGRWTERVERERKALDAVAARNGGRIDLAYSASQERLEIIEVATIKADGRHLPVPADLIIDAAPQVSRDVALYTDMRTRSVVFPDLEAGDSIRYVYRRTSIDRTWPGFSQNIVWFKNMRTLLSERIFDAPSTMKLEVEAHGVGYHVEPLGDRVRRTLTWSNPNPTPVEAGAVSEFDWGSRATVSTYASYAEIGDYYGTLHSEAAGLTADMRSLAADIVKGAADREDEARRLYDWVTRKIRYVGVEIGKGKLKPASAEETLRNRYGDCKAMVALLSALLQARGIASEPVLMDTNFARYSMPDVPATIFNHVILYIPGFDRYVDATWHNASFGILPWGHYGKPVLHAVPGRSRLAQVPMASVAQNEAEVLTKLSVTRDGRISGTSRETVVGTMAGDVRNYASDTSAAKARDQLQHLGTPGTGRWTRAVVDPSSPNVELVGEFDLSDQVDLASGEPFVPTAGLRFSVRPGLFLLGSHNGPRHYPFPCYGGRQAETIEVAIPAGVRPIRLPVERHLKTAVAEYNSSYAFSNGTLLVKREFIAHPDRPVCPAEIAGQLSTFLAAVGRDVRAAITFMAN
jgi:transglutaminase-like putative cysteine protease